MATVHEMSNYSVAVFLLMLNEWFKMLLTAHYLNPALNMVIHFLWLFF